MEEQKLNHTVVSVVSSITNMNNNEETKATITTVPLPPPPSSYAVAEVTAMIAAQGNSGRGSVGKKKRGRPRKYDSDGKLNERYQSPKSPPGFTLSPTQPNKACGKSSFGEAFANSAGGDFTPHVVTIYKGEGLFEILSLSGSFAVSENSDIRSRSGGLSVLLAGPDGRVLGGAVAGLLTAAGPIQIVMGSFIPNGTKTHKKKQNRKHTAASPISGGPDTVTATRPLSQENPNVDGDNFHLVMSQLQEQSNIESVSVTTSGDTQNIDATPNAAATRNGSNELSDQRVSPDINISLQDE
ncbi:hypothetical protein Lal_00038104 [Lupinus albus]|nr:hypothetical protein Lal_00038104 [Lupinus albus]